MHLRGSGEIWEGLEGDTKGDVGERQRKGCDYTLK